MITISKKWGLIVLGIIILLFLIWGNYNAWAKISKFQKVITDLKDKKQTFSIKALADGKTIAEQEQLILSQKEAISLGLIEIENLKKVKSQVKFVTNTKIDSVVINFTDTVEIIKRDSITYVPVPQLFKMSDKWFNFNATLNKKGLVIDSLLFINKFDVTIGYKKRSIFRQAEPIVLLKNHSPYTNTIEMNNVIVQEEKKFYDRKGFWFGCGAFFGLLLPNLK